MKWVLQMALRDARRSWGRLILTVSATSIGIGALVAAGLFRANIERAIQDQAKPLLGGDIVIRHRAQFSAEDRAFFNSLPHPQLNEIELRTVAYFPQADSSRLVEVRAVENGFPFYGEIKTLPTGGVTAIFKSQGAMVDESVLAEFNLKVGDAIQLGQETFTILGAVQLVPSEVMTSVFSSPQVFIDFKHLEKTGLNQAQSLARHRITFKIENEQDLKTAMALIEPRDKINDWNARTVAQHQRSLGRRIDNTARFLKLAALISLMLGGIGVASLWTVYAKDKRPLAAVLRCLGTPARHIFQIFLVQSLVLALIGSTLGAGIGLLLQSLLPGLLKKTFEVDIPFILSWQPILGGFAVGFVVTFLFTLLALIPLNRVSPLAVLRESFEGNLKIMRDVPRLTVLAVLFIFVFLFARHETSRTTLALAVPVGIAVGYWVVSLLVQFLMTIFRRSIRSSWPYALRQGMANLFRPHNQTHVFVTTLSIGSALIFSVAFLNESLLHNLSLSVGDREPTLALFDIQPAQRDGVKNILASNDSSLVEEVPFVSMQIHQIKSELINDMEDPSWAHRREYRSSYRDTLSPREKLIDGIWPPAASNVNGNVPISIEEDIMDDLKVKMGDPLVFNVQGVLINTVITAVRAVDWFQLRPNFFMVFPGGVLDQAPQFIVMLARTPSLETTGNIQREVRSNFPNVSIVDLRMILETIRNYFGKVALALQTMAFFVAATGLLILISALIAGRYERMRDATLLRVLGAPIRTIRAIHIIEYGLIGFFSGIFGLALAWAGSFLAASRLFEIAFNGQLLTGLMGVLVMMVTSTLTGLFMGRGSLKESN